MELLIIINYKTKIDKEIKLKHLIGGLALVILIIILYKNTSLILSNPVVEDFQQTTKYIYQEFNKAFEFEKTFDMRRTFELPKQIEEFYRYTGNQTKEIIKCWHEINYPKWCSDIEIERQAINDLIQKATTYLRG